MPRNHTNSPKPVEAHKHKDKRANIPTEELRDFVEDQEKAPKKILYPRDQSLDPQLVWKGKDEQDAAPLEVPAVPIYIQEKIHPQAIIEDLRRHNRGGDGPSPSAGREGKGDKLSPPLKQQEFSLFADFNGLQFEQLIEFYQHKDGVNWANRMILGDSLLVMTSLAEKEGLKGKVQMIYLDPPYGIKFGSNWQVSTRKRDVKDGKAEDATRQPEQIRAFRDTWKLGIHSYLAYLRDRLVVARELLTESGSVFVQIGAENVHLVRCILEEVFGAENFVSLITFATTSGFEANELARAGDYLLWFAKNKAGGTKYRALFEEQQREVGEGLNRFVKFPDGFTRPLTSEEVAEGKLPTDTTLYSPDNMLSQGPASVDQTFNFYGGTFSPGSNSHWKPNFPTGISRLGKAGRLHVAKNSLRFIRLAKDFPLRNRNNLWTDTLTGQFTDEKIYVVQTNLKIVERCLLMTTDPGDLVLDPTCGSGTTAYVAEQWGRRWITCDTSRVALALARTRLMAAKFPYYLLADSEQGWRKEMEVSGSFVAQASSPAGSGGVLAASAGSGDAPPTRSRDGRATFDGDLKRGFVYRRVPHITLKSIANNEEIDAIHAEFAPKLEKALIALNKAAKKSWLEWEVPRELPSEFCRSRRKEAQISSEESQRLVTSSPTEAEKAHAEFWQMRLERQQAIDASIARRAETELLYDQPHEDPKRIRVTGPITVESLSPHRVLSADENQDGTVTEVEGRKHHDFVTMILDNLKKAGVQNTRKEERLKFETLESYAGQWIHAVGTFEERAGAGTAGPQESKEKTSGDRLSPPLIRRAAICIGPEHGTVGPELVKEAAKEAVQGVGFDLLIICGFAFDPHVPEEIKRYGKLAVVPARMNPDLAMGDELLKKTGAGNLFMVFGEPDVDVTQQKDGKLVVEIKGVDIYDPTTGQIRNSSTDDIACWFIDTDYNGESFFVRHAYFTGADEPYEKLKRALRADIDEAAWQTLYSTQSHPFERPKSGKIAIKVINHYGDEVLKVYQV